MLDQITQASDPRDIDTGYTTNGFGDVMQEISADRGIIDSTYDSARNLKTVIDARGGKHTAVSLVCELLSICNDAGQWMFCTSEADQVESLVGGWVGNYETAPLA
ncbi:hypothetical protein [Nitrosomonas ureae]|uniref:hypothetical protein n=1 Tax=Nitrosomonas ureae TaxID=44577 RepID=UPI000944609C|nr:hypothetical protein [Nitrosomonas ureae]